MNSYYLELSYAKRLGTRLERHHQKKVSPYLAAARCPVCGDSHKNKSKTRFIIYEKSKSLNVYCHNCGLSTTLIKFLKTDYKDLFDEYVFENYKHSAVEKEKPPEFVPQPIATLLTTLDLPYLSELPADHHAVEYVNDRQLPDYKFQYAERFFEFSEQYKPELKERKTKKDEPRLIIPFFDKSGNVYAYQGRDLSGKSSLKYITIIVNKTIPKIFGICQVDWKKPVYLVEGPLDSLFIPNCIASVNASLKSTASKLLPLINKNQSKITLILDNEPRNSAVVSEYDKAIESGFDVVIWPDNIRQKDINEMVIANLDVKKIIAENTYRGLSAKLKFNQWKKT
jgi:transcription elongation factor Elf1